MHALFSLLGIKGLYMFRPLLAHLQQAVHKLQLVHCVRVMSAGCTRIGVELATRTQYTKCFFLGSWFRATYSKYV
jgi:hypothetical protein